MRTSKLEVILPSLVAAFPDRYAMMGLRDLSDEMFDHYKQSGQIRRFPQQAFSTLPNPEMIPAEALSAAGAQPSRTRSAGRGSPADCGDEHSAVSAWNPDDDAW